MGILSIFSKKVLPGSSNRDSFSLLGSHQELIEELARKKGNPVEVAEGYVKSIEEFRPEEARKYNYQNPEWRRKAVETYSVAVAAKRRGNVTELTDLNGNNIGDDICNGCFRYGNNRRKIDGQLIDCGRAPMSQETRK